eukprot:TRINITY_DN3599_c0_g2_i1.p1 TRINITY_DN3599_c0_g2~~TRINITY_DN3599_c0_g2_i1.p1  ORF type:complete len:216 (-),score=-22.24 TRINITY_DN3599_c0_g2_i1:223-870(-)
MPHRFSMCYQQNQQLQIQTNYINQYNIQMCLQKQMCQGGARKIFCDIVTDFSASIFSLQTIWFLLQLILIKKIQIFQQSTITKLSNPLLSSYFYLVMSQQYNNFLVYGTNASKNLRYKYLSLVVFQQFLFLQNSYYKIRNYYICFIDPLILQWIIISSCLLSLQTTMVTNFLYATMLVHDKSILNSQKTYFIKNVRTQMGQKKVLLLTNMIVHQK